MAKDITDQIFTNVSNIDPYAEIEKEEKQVSAQRSLPDLDSFAAGKGNSVMRFDERGLWLGADQPTTAPFFVTVGGEVTLRDGIIRIYDDSNNLVISIG